MIPVCSSRIRILIFLTIPRIPGVKTAAPDPGSGSPQHWLLLTLTSWSRWASLASRMTICSLSDSWWRGVATAVVTAAALWGVGTAALWQGWQ
jgi:hypothetical protein